MLEKFGFVWDVSMAKKLDPVKGCMVSYQNNDLEEYWIPTIPKKGRRRWHRRRLSYSLIWKISEMQLKLYVQPYFSEKPGEPVAPRAIHLAHQLSNYEDCYAPEAPPTKVYTIHGESISEGLSRDISMTDGVRRQRFELLEGAQADDDITEQLLSSMTGLSQDRSVNNDTVRDTHSNSDQTARASQDVETSSNVRPHLSSIFFKVILLAQLTKHHRSLINIKTIN